MYAYYEITIQDCVQCVHKIIITIARITNLPQL